MDTPSAKAANVQHKVLMYIAPAMLRMKISREQGHMAECMQLKGDIEQLAMIVLTMLSKPH